MQNAIPGPMKRLADSNKARAAVSAILLVVAQRLGLPIDDDTLILLVGIISAWILSQGITDTGKPAAQLQIDADKQKTAPLVAKNPAAKKRVRKRK